jgi:hypothetical protein
MTQQRPIAQPSPLAFLGKLKWTTPNSLSSCSRLWWVAYSRSFRRDFEDAGIVYNVSRDSKADLYDQFEPLLNAGEIELIDDSKLVEQLLTLVVGRNGKIDHLPGDHDDYANACCGAIVLAAKKDKPFGDWLSSSRKWQK